MIDAMTRMTPQQIRRQHDAERIRAGHRLTFTAHYEPERGTLSWFVQVAELYAAAHAPSFEEIEGTVRDLVVVILDVDRDAFDVSLARGR